MSTDLAARIASDICKHPKLAGAPVPVIDAAVERTLEWLAENLWPECTVSDISDDDFRWCESCGEVIAPDDFGVIDGGEDCISLHKACVEQPGEVA